LNPGPHGPESHGVPSSYEPFGDFQFESVPSATSLVQIEVNFNPDCYTNYYMATREPLARKYILPDLRSEVLHSGRGPGGSTGIGCVNRFRRDVACPSRHEALK